MTDACDLKRELAEPGALTEMGFTETAAPAARIRALAARLEALNPSEEPARASALLRGRWRLLYSNFGFARETNLARLSFNVLPPEPVFVVEMLQEVDPANGHYDNLIVYTDARGEPGQLVMVGEFRALDERQIDIGFTHAVQMGPMGQVRLPIDHGRIPPLQSDISYLDDGFRLHRSSTGNLYMFERLDDAPMRWARES
jgi:hypothetical protein